MAEFVHGEKNHVDEAFDDFIAKHDKEYSHESERESKKDAFRQNMRYINSMNRQNLSYKVIYDRYIVIRRKSLRNLNKVSKNINLLDHFS